MEYLINLGCKWYRELCEARETEVGKREKFGMKLKIRDTSMKTGI